MLSSLGLSQPSIKVILHQTLIFLHPPALAEIPAQDPILRGEVVLTLPKAREVKSLSVKLVGHYNLSFPDTAWETGRTLEKEVYLDTSLWPGGGILEKGEHRFTFAIVIPSSTAPYERGQHGRVYHRVYGVAKMGGVVGTAVEDEAGLEIVVNPAAEGDMMGCNIRAEGFADELGPYCIDLTSQHLTVGGLLHFSLQFPSTPNALDIIAIEASILQNFSLTSLQDPKKKASPPPHKRRIFRFDENSNKHDIPSVSIPPVISSLALKKNLISPPGTPKGVVAAIAQGEGYQVSHLVRLPDDDHLRATTQPGSNTIIRVSHEAVVEVKFRNTEEMGPAKIFKITRPITFSSCCCMMESLMLPSYSQEDPLCSKEIAEDARRRTRNRKCMTCICGCTMESLVRDHGAQAKGPEDGIADAIVPIKIENPLTPTSSGSSA